MDYEEIEYTASDIAAGKNKIFRLNAAEEQNGRGIAGRTAIESTIVADAAEGAGGGHTATPEQRQGTAKRSTQALIDYAHARGVWFELKVIKIQHKYLTEGSEAEVYIDSADTRYVIKVASFVDDTPLHALDNRIALYNYIFPETAYELIGFTNNEWGDLAFVLRQPFIKGKLGATQEKVDEMMKERGLEFQTNFGAYVGQDHKVHDVHELNVITDLEGEAVVIDAVPGLNTANREFNTFKIK